MKHADEIWPPGLAGPLRSNESNCCSLPSEQTEKTRDECFGRDIQCDGLYLYTMSRWHVFISWKFKMFRLF